MKTRHPERRRPSPSPARLDPDVLPDRVVAVGYHGGKAVIRAGDQGAGDHGVHSRRGLVVERDHLEVPVPDRGDVTGVAGQVLAPLVQVPDVVRRGELAWLGSGVMPQVVDRYLVDLDHV